jgi:uncharacterized protein (DUF305 family)
VPRLAALLVALLVAACGACAEPGPAQRAEATGDLSRASGRSPGPERNPQDVDFAHAVTALHQQALAMVRMVDAKQVSPSLRRVADTIRRHRRAELDDVSTLLRALGERPHQDLHGSVGELTMRELSRLYAHQGADFEEAWLDAMRGNHRGAVSLARTELARGLNLDARELARDLVRAQGADLEVIEELAAAR